MFRALLITLLLLPVFARAQSVNGIITDADSSTPVDGVAVQNIYTHTGLLTDSTGKFSIDGIAGQLIEFRKLGYKTARVRVPAPPYPPYYHITLQTGAFELDEVQITDRYRNFKKDSLRNYETFKSELNFPKLQGLDMIRHPFSALSKRNQQIWKFQREYTMFEQEKYVDYAFNEKLIANLTGFKGDSVKLYMQRFRPSYEMLHAMKDYEFYLYIKETVTAWRGRQYYRPARSVGGG